MNLTMYFMLPIIKGITEIQRKGKKAFVELLDGENKKTTIYLADRNKIFAVVLSVEEYEKITEKINEDNILWLKAAEKILGFWNDRSNDIYEKLL